MVARNSQQQARMRARIAATRANCHICGGEIDYKLKWPDPRSFVVDHIVPLARGGAHDITNAAAAHADCNSTKRARSHAPIVKRSGSFQ